MENFILLLYLYYFTIVSCPELQMVWPAFPTYLPPAYAGGCYLRFYWPKVSVFLLQFNALLIRNFSFANFNWTSAKLVEPIRNFTFQCEAFSSAAPTLLSQNHLGFKQSLIWPPSIILSLSSLSECTQKYSQKMHQKP